MLTTTKERLLSLLRPAGQERLIAFWDSLTAEQRERLAGQIEAIDYPLIDRLAREESSAESIRALADRAGSPPSVRLGDPANRFSPEEARRRGGEALRAGKIGVMLVAGGQGTRLGFDHPKGMFPVGPVSNRTLFEIHLDKLLAVARRYGRSIPLYLMTSPATHDETVAYFREKGDFGLSDDLFVFCQGTMPAVDAASGKILLASPGSLALSPDGHGGMLAALAKAGGLDHARGRGIEQIFYFQVDNPLVDIASPEFLGYHLLAGSEMTTQVVRKRAAKEKVGNVVAVDGRLRVIEYSDLPDEIAERRNADGSLAIWAGSIAVHAFAVDFLHRAAANADALPFHRAHKKVAHLGPSGERVEPNRPNAVKFERFIFDLMPWAKNALVVEVDPQEHFGPLKNASGDAQDTPETVRAQLVALHTRWLREAGAEVEDGVPVEISPRFALDVEELKTRIGRGVRIVGSTYFR